MRGFLARHRLLYLAFAGSLTVSSASAQNLAFQPVSASVLSAVSPESVGAQSTGGPGADGLGATLWKGTPRLTAVSLLALAAPTASPVLNDLARRLLKTAAVPPEGDAPGLRSLTSLRVEKLAAFGSDAAAWSLAKQADASLVDDKAFQNAAEIAQASESGDPCADSAVFVKARAGADWQKFLIVCQLRGKDMKPALVGLDVLRAQSKKDDAFVTIADKNILGGGVILPTRLTPLEPTTLSLLRIAALPVPATVYGHPGFDLVPALLRMPAKLDDTRLGLAERAAARGMIGGDELAAVYADVKFRPEELASPLSSGETGPRLRALFFQAARDEKDPAGRVADAVAFAQYAPADLVNGAGVFVASMLGDMKADPALKVAAVAIARLYIVGGHKEEAADWLKLARLDPANDTALLNMWPQLALAKLAPKDDFNAWFDAALKGAEVQTDAAAARDRVGGALLLLNAAGVAVPDAAWARMLDLPRGARHVAFSPVLFARMQDAVAGGRKGEALLLAIALAGENNVSLSASVGITDMLRRLGFADEAAVFAWQAMAALDRPN